MLLTWPSAATKALQVQVCGRDKAVCSRAVLCSLQAHMATQLQLRHSDGAEARAEALQAADDAAREARIAQADALQSAQTSMFKCDPQRFLDSLVWFAARTKRDLSILLHITVLPLRNEGVSEVSKMFVVQQTPAGQWREPRPARANQPSGCQARCARAAQAAREASVGPAHAAGRLGRPPGVR